MSIEASRAWGSRLLAGRVSYFPIRHHSPACAWHLQRLIETRRPRTVLIEGPSQFNRFVDLLDDAATVPPVAIYSYCNFKAREGRPARLGAYYPFAAFSPEWVALKSARRSGAAVRFIDLDFAAQTLLDQADRLTGRSATLLEEHAFQRSAWLRQLAASLGCRDVDELWDRLFESWARELPLEEFVARVATYCELARRDVPVEVHERDGTTAREAQMAWHIASAAAGDGEVLVVTGGYHTVVLPDLVARQALRPDIDQGEVVASGDVLVRYSFDRLDRTNGYGAGMPSPAFYQRAWDEPGAVALGVLTDVAGHARESSVEGAPMTSSLIAALEQAERLASLRGNRHPTRSDLWDAIESCFLQGAGLGQSHPVAVIARTVLSGAQVGQVPAAAGLPPIVADFNLHSRACRLDIDSTAVRELALDIYAEPRTRPVSRFLHQLDFLKVPFAHRVAGPDFIGRRAGRRRREVWQYAWSPETESGLIDAAAYGSTVLEAVSQRFADSVAASGSQGTQSAALAAERLTVACQLGLHDQVPFVMQWLRQCVRVDPSFKSVADTVQQLALLWQARQPLEARGLEDVSELARAAFDRAAYLCQELGGLPPDQASVAATALIGLREVMVGELRDWFDAEVLWQAVALLARQPDAQPVVAGAAAGMLFSAGALSEAELGSLLGARVRPPSDPLRGVSLLRGLLLAAREVLWQSDGVLAALRSVIETDDTSAFVRMLPELRLALSVLTPLETDRVAQAAAAALGVTGLKATVDYQLSAAEVQANQELSLRLRAVLERDGLGGWLSTPA